MTRIHTRGGATGPTGRRLRRVPDRRSPAAATPPPLRRRSVEESKLIAGLFAVALTLGLGGVIVVAEAPAVDRAEVTAAFLDSPARTLGLALGGGTVVGGPGAPPSAPPAMAGDTAPAAADGGPPAPSGGFSPRSLTIDSLGITTGVLSTGMTADRNLEVPQDPQQVGWYRGFAEPGDPGVSVLLGHVDSRQGPGVFFRLPELEVGAEIAIERSDGRTVRYEVDRVEWHPKDDFPTLEVYTSERAEVLRLITCGGEFDRERRTYLENVVVTAVPIDDPDEPGHASIPQAV